MNENLKLRDTECTNFSTPIESEHILIIPKKTFHPNESVITTKNNLLTENLMNNFSINNESETSRSNKSKKGCCSFLSNLFKKK